MPSITSDVPILVAVAIATFGVPAALVIAVVIAVRGQRAGTAFRERDARRIAFLAGASLGTLLLYGLDMDLFVWVPLVATVIVLATGRVRARKHVQAGLLLLGAGLPFAIVLLNLVLRSDPTTDWVLVGSPAAGSALAVAMGLILVRRGDPAPASPDMRAVAGQPGSRAMGSIAEAIRGPTFIGPIGVPELAMLVAFVASWFVVPLVLPAGVPAILRVGLAGVLAALLGTEAYVRGMPSRSRRAFEAFSWLGEWELARLREQTGGGVPTMRDELEQWLAAHPERPEILPVRIEALAYAERFDEARDALTRLPTETAWERFEVAALRDLVDWRAGGDGDLAGMQETAADIRPPDTDERLRAEVTIAVAQVRRRMADGRAEAGDAAQPLLDVRTRLGTRADGQVGRALRPRLLPGLIVVDVVIAVASLLLGSGA